MKKMLLLGLLALISGVAFAQTTILLEDFEDATVTYTIDPATSEYSDGGFDYFTRTDGSNIGSVTYTNLQGASYFGA